MFKKVMTTVANIAYVGTAVAVVAGAKAVELAANGMSIAAEKAEEFRRAAVVEAARKEVDRFEKVRKDREAAEAKARVEARVAARRKAHNEAVAYMATVKKAVAEGKI